MCIWSDCRCLIDASIAVRADVTGCATYSPAGDKQHAMCIALAAAEAVPGQQDGEQAPEDLDARPGGTDISATRRRMAGFTTESLEVAVAELVTDLTGSSPAPDQPLAAQGLDSLAAMELRQKLQASAFLARRAALASCIFPGIC